MEGWIKMYRQFLNWEWYKDNNTKALFIHLMILANHKEGKWQGNTIGRGQLITSREHLASALNLTVQQVRTSLKKLQKTGEITIKPTNKYSLITIEKYEYFQSGDAQSNQQDNQQITNKQPADNQQITTNKNDNNENNVNNDLILINKIKQQMKEKGFFVTDNKIIDCLKIAKKHGAENLANYVVAMIIEEVN